MATGQPPRSPEASILAQRLTAAYLGEGGWDFTPTPGELELGAVLSMTAGHARSLGAQLRELDRIGEPCPGVQDGTGEQVPVLLGPEWEIGQMPTGIAKDLLAYDRELLYQRFDRARAKYVELSRGDAEAIFRDKLGDFLQSAFVGLRGLFGGSTPAGHLKCEVHTQQSGLIISWCPAYAHALVWTGLSAKKSTPTDGFLLPGRYVFAGQAPGGLPIPELTPHWDITNNVNIVQLSTV